MLAPFPYFGGKSAVAAEVWKRFGDVKNYVEPFFGSGAMLLGRPEPFIGTETVNDVDGFVSNFWRSVRADPAAVADHANWPANENDKHARHAWLVGKTPSLASRLEGNPDFFDAKIAGWWVWGKCLWIGGGWCSGKGPWRVVDGELVKGGEGPGVTRQILHLSTGNGIHRPTVATYEGEKVLAWLTDLSKRLRMVRVCSGDWSRVVKNTPTVGRGLMAVFLDPPYADTAKRTKDLYSCDSLTVAHDVREWAIAHGDDERLRIALSGYEGEHKMPKRWTCFEWKAQGGYAAPGTAASENRKRERIWFSPHCLRVKTRKAA